mmetsp:Transcript_48144/g.148586  ORF Transcript_48144/g.148586 Transcript_48144/m.148586 type:complete len:233 (-) Transcript_48144:13-711(-)
MPTKEGRWCVGVSCAMSAPGHSNTSSAGSSIWVGGRSPAASGGREAITHAAAARPGLCDFAELGRRRGDGLTHVPPSATIDPACERVSGPGGPAEDEEIPIGEPGTDVVAAAEPRRAAHVDRRRSRRGDGSTEPARRPRSSNREEAAIAASLNGLAVFVALQAATRSITKCSFRPRAERSPAASLEETQPIPAGGSLLFNRREGRYGGLGFGGVSRYTHVAGTRGNLCLRNQ